jgi:hypothetical protein
MMFVSKVIMKLLKPISSLFLYSTQSKLTKSYSSLWYFEKTLLFNLILFDLFVFAYFVFAHICVYFYKI